MDNATLQPDEQPCTIDNVVNLYDDFLSVQEGLDDERAQAQADCNAASADPSIDDSSFPALSPAGCAVKNLLDTENDPVNDCGVGVWQHHE